MIKRIKWLIKQFLLMYSDQASFFSKKRFESGLAFFTAIGLDVIYLISHWNSISSTDFLLHLTLLFTVAGYTLNLIQKEKATSLNDNIQ